MIGLEASGDISATLPCYACTRQRRGASALHAGMRSAFALQFGNKLVDLPFFQQVNTRPLLPSDGPAEFGHEEIGFERFGESPAGLQSPLLGQGGIFPFHVADVARNLNRDPLSTQGGRRVGTNRLSVSVEMD